ncbi:MAG TPA: sugar kinase [Galbitalea sp.]|jgi:2-dehydro-3-deoxygluconokinase|nr:sugar kinase [Galbitalea sp.]
MKPVVTLGETMGLFRAVTPGPLSQVTEFELGFGGADSNVAIGLARLGTPVRWVGRVGSDGIGDRIIRELEAEGVDVVAITDPSAPTGLMIKEQGTSDARPVIYYRTNSAGSRLTPDDVATADIEHAALLHVTGITPALSETAHDAVLSAIRVAEAAGVPISFDVNHRGSLWRDRDHASVYRELASAADIVFAGDDEARILVPDAGSPAEQSTAIAAAGPSQVIIKLGARGCVAHIDGVDYTQAALSITPIDTVGAGDAFVAGYLAELISGSSPAERLRTAAAVGAYACLHIGDWEGFPTRAELARLEANAVD